MKYMGSKSRITKYIVPIIQQKIDESGYTSYVEPFVGGANVIDKINCKNRYGSDSNKYLIALLQTVRDGYPLLENVPREFYNTVRENVGTEMFEDWVVGCVGFLASFNGRFFDGGYAQAGYEKTKTGLRYRDYYQESKRNLLAQADKLKDIWFLHRDYREWNELSQCVIYVDPPYENTKQFANSKDFDHKEFWELMRLWSKNNIVLISEENAPEDFTCIWEQEVSRSIKANEKSNSTEKLFIYSK